jgi:murein DD-endopeptidase MepM/ murein hydrolase activator NlpD
MTQDRTPTDPPSNLGPACFYPAEPEDRLYKLPWDAGIALTVGDGAFNRPHYTDHKGYEFDWLAEAGFPVLAARAGVVQAIEASLVRVRRTEPVPYEHVTTTDWYIHVQTEGLPIEIGQSVCQGQLLTWLTPMEGRQGPHLHFEVHVKGHKGVGHNGRTLQSVPVPFVEVTERSDGVPFVGDVCVSQNLRSGESNGTDTRGEEKP